MFSFLNSMDKKLLQFFVIMLPEEESILSPLCPSVCLSRYLVQQIALKLLLPFKSNLVYI